mgnify:CR=1 FL=1
MCHPANVVWKWDLDPKLSPYQASQKSTAKAPEIHSYDHVRSLHHQPIKTILYRELAEGSRNVRRPLLRYKNTMKVIFKGGSALNTWREIVGDRSAWRRFTSNVCNTIKRDRKESNNEKRRNTTRRIMHSKLSLLNL